jgi:hypothetical protein
VEARPLRRLAPNDVRVVESGIALATQSDIVDDVVIVCGVAGGLREDLPTGTVLIPERVHRPDGEDLQCDAAAMRALTDAATQLGYPPVHDPLVTCRTIVHGAERAFWAQRGYAGVDMETGLLHGPRIAGVRVILDTPLHEISPAWAQPARALLQPRAWRDLPFLMRDGSRCATVAAQIAVSAAKQLVVV